MPTSHDIPNRYSEVHTNPDGPGDGRPSAFQVLKDEGLIGSLRDKTVLLTGGTNGIGLETVRQLAKTGARVFFTARNTMQGEKVKREILEEGHKDDDLKSARLEVLKLDLKILASVREAAAQFLQMSDQLNVLINNAGIAMTPHEVTGNGFESQFQVNHLAHFLLFQLLAPTLIKSSSPAFHSRVISLSSLAHHFSSVHIGDYNLGKLEGGYNPLVAYGHSKTCNIWFANELERRYSARGVHGLSVHPGGIESTGLQNSHDPSVLPMLEQALQLEHIKKSMKNVGQGAATTVLAAVGKEFEGIGGLYLEDCSVSKPLPDDPPMGAPGYKPWAYDAQGEKQLWDDSLRMVT